VNSSAGTFPQSSGVHENGSTPAIDLGSSQDVTIDGMKRSGIMIYGFDQAIWVNSGSNITMRNIETFDNGVVSHGTDPSPVFGSPARGRPTGYWSDGFSVSLERGGTNLTFDRMLLHDDGQDNFHGGHAFNNIAITNSWIFNSRENPIYPGFSFMTGPVDLCIHPDAMELWNATVGDGMTVQNDIIGPYLWQGLYPTDGPTMHYNNVSITNTLFFNVIYQAINTYESAPTGWTMSNLTFYRYGQNPDGTYCCSLDGKNWSGDTLTNSISYGGYINDSGLSGSNNVYYNSNGATLAGGTHVNPNFVQGLTSTTPSWPDFQTVNLTAQCSLCSGKGSSLHTLRDILNRIDSLNEVEP
jgi:hypothetical protein